MTLNSLLQESCDTVEYYISTAGTTSNDCASENTPCRTINDVFNKYGGKFFCFMWTCIPFFLVWYYPRYAADYYSISFVNAFSCSPVTLNNVVLHIHSLTTTMVMFSPNSTSSLSPFVVVTGGHLEGHNLTFLHNAAVSTSFFSVNSKARLHLRYSDITGGDTPSTTAAPFVIVGDGCSLYLYVCNVLYLSFSTASLTVINGAGICGLNSCVYFFFFFLVAIVTMESCIVHDINSTNPKGGVLLQLDSIPSSNISIGLHNNSVSVIRVGSVNMAGGIYSMVGGSLLNVTINKDSFSLINVSGNCNGGAIYIGTAAAVSLIVTANQVLFLL
jgi:hypothetical protein